MGSVQNAQVHSKTSDQGSASRQSVNQHNQLLHSKGCYAIPLLRVWSLPIQQCTCQAHICVGTLVCRHRECTVQLAASTLQCCTALGWEAWAMPGPCIPCSEVHGARGSVQFRRVGWAARSSHPKRSKGQLSLMIHWMQAEVSSTPSPRAGP